MQFSMFQVQATMEPVRTSSSLPIWAEWAQAIIVVIGGIVAIGMLILYYYEYRKEREEFRRAGERQRVEKAIELAKQFAKDTIPLIGDIFELTKNETYRKDVIKRITGKSKLNFDYPEAISLVRDKAILAEKDIENLENLGIINKIDDLLNELEAMSIALIKNVADEETVYQSLHGIFITTIQYLYLNIALKNIGVAQGPEKLYTGCIELYCKWQYRKMENTMKWENKAKEISIEHENTLRDGAIKSTPLDM